MFVCHQASIARQFEVIQGQWLNDGDAFWLGIEPDVLTVAGELRQRHRRSRRCRPTFLPKPRTVRHHAGGGYFFTPGISHFDTSPREAGCDHETAYRQPGGTHRPVRGIPRGGRVRPGMSWWAHLTS